MPPSLTIFFLFDPLLAHRDHSGPGRFILVKIKRPTFYLMNPRTSCSFALGSNCLIDALQLLEVDLKNANGFSPSIQKITSKCPQYLQISPLSSAANHRQIRQHTGSTISSETLYFVDCESAEFLVSNERYIN